MYDGCLSEIEMLKFFFVTSMPCPAGNIPNNGALLPGATSFYAPDGHGSYNYYGSVNPSSWYYYHMLISYAPHHYSVTQYYYYFVKFLIIV